MFRPRDVSLRVAAVLALFVVDSTAASADCRAKAEAAIQKVDRPDRPYRSVMTVGRTYRETIEFIPPDRMRKIADSPNWIENVVAYLAGEGPIGTIQIGDRRWERWGKKWADYGFAAKALPEVLSSEAPPADATFACLDAVAFEGATYIGYQISFRPTHMLVVTFGTSTSKMQQEEEALKAAAPPPRWRTILVHRETRLPAYDLMTATSQLDSPQSMTHYTYPRDLTIEPPAP
jgi:hypothetical protein